MPAQPQAQSSQDWKPQTFHFHGASGGGGNKKSLSESEANRIGQQGNGVDVVKKQSNSNQHSNGLGPNARKLDDDHENFKVKKVDFKLTVAIQKARQLKGWTQAELGKEINEKATVVTEYENGKAVPVEAVVVRMEKALGVHLRGAKAGEPMEVKKTKAQLAALKGQ